MITRLSHVCFVVEDVDKSVDFYTNAFGIRHAFDFIREGEKERYGAYMYFGERTFIEVFKRKPDQPKPTNSHSFSHFCVEVDSMEKTVAELRAKGVEVSEPKMGMDGNPQAWLADPDGNRIELHELRPDGWQLQAVKRLDAK